MVYGILFSPSNFIAVAGGQTAWKGGGGEELPASQLHFNAKSAENYAMAKYLHKLPFYLSSIVLVLVLYSTRLTR